MASPPAILDSDADDEEEFYDCKDEERSFNDSTPRSTNRLERPFSTGTPITIKFPTHHQTNGNAVNFDENEESEWGGRCQLPSTMISRNDFSIWSFLRRSIGKELSKITMPLEFNEPLSFLQRVVEYMEYSELLVQAVNTDDPILRHELVTAFAVSASASNAGRLGKPFNPMLGETYELNREDLGYRIVCEQVSHHPPVSAFHVDAKEFTFHGCIYPKLKFWGSSIQVIPKGLVTLRLHRHNEVYTWQNINCSVHNVIIGKIWIEHYGEMEVTNHTTKRKAVLQFKPCGWLGTDPHKIQGCLYDESKKKVRVFYGKWTESFYSVDVDVWERYMKSSGKDAYQTSNSKSVSDMKETDTQPEDVGSCNLKLSRQRLLWSAKPKPSKTSKYYNFTSFALMLNELDGAHAGVAPTDCRMRPDMRLMEEGDVDNASFEKNRIEEKQREARKLMKKNKQEFVPRWFESKYSKYTGCEEWQSNGLYWNRRWDNCPDIF